MDGTPHWLRAKGRMFFDTEGRPERMVGFMFDVTEWRHAQEELRISEARFRTLVDHATDAFYLSDDQSRIIDVNEAACQMMGCSRAELIGRHPREFDVGLDEASIARLAQRVLEGKTVTFETLHRRRDGSVFPVEIRGRGFEQRGRRLLLALVRDITERKLAEETLREKDQALQVARTELARVSRLTTLGELTTSIAHEVSQPLGAMTARAGACARWLEADPPALAEARTALDNIVADGKRAREVIARVRALTRRQVPHKHQLDINHQIVEVLALMKHELSSHDIVLRTDLGPAPLNVAGDRVQLQQVLLNLIVNAIEAMSAVHDRPRELTITSSRQDSDSVLVEVRDRGTGLEPQRTEKVFEAFYTTKSEGIGIGLAISRSIVEAHGGRLWAAPHEPHGAVFRFSLPVAREVDA
jgi:PAS domain S-box-containing protein